MYENAHVAGSLSKDELSLGKPLERQPQQSQASAGQQARWAKAAAEAARTAPPSTTPAPQKASKLTADRDPDSFFMYQRTDPEGRALTMHVLKKR